MVSISKEEIIPVGEENWSIEPQRSLFDLRLGELWHYRDLVLLFVRRGFVAVYKQTICRRRSHLRRQARPQTIGIDVSNPFEGSVEESIRLWNE